MYTHEHITNTLHQLAALLARSMREAERPDDMGDLAAWYPPTRSMLRQYFDHGGDPTECDEIDVATWHCHTAHLDRGFAALWRSLSRFVQVRPAYPHGGDENHDGRRQLALCADDARDKGRVATVEIVAGTGGTAWRVHVETKQGTKATSTYDDIPDNPKATALAAARIASRLRSCWASEGRIDS